MCPFMCPSCAPAVAEVDSNTACYNRVADAALPGSGSEIDPLGYFYFGFIFMNAFLNKLALIPLSYAVLIVESLTNLAPLPMFTFSS